MDSKSELLPIGRFAELSRLSLKALRLYDAHGVLIPAWIDPETGYRHYAPDQLTEARRVLLLRRIGLSLEAIRAGNGSLDAAEAGVREARRRANEAERALETLRRLHEDPDMDFPIETKTLPAHDALLWSGRVTIEVLEPTIRGRLADLSAAAGTDADPAVHPYVVYVGPVNEGENGPIEIVLPLKGPISPPEGLAVRRVAATEAASTTVHGDQAEFPAILGAYHAVFMWAHANGRNPAGPPREIMLTEDASAFEIALPLE